MSHTIYTTEGFILKSINFGEANRYFFILTKEFGLLKVTAQGIRYLKSKLRYSLEDFSYVQISVVRGRELWRLTSAEKKYSFPVQNLEQEKLLLLSQIFSLLLRLLHGEERNDLLFENIKDVFIFLLEEDFSSKELSNLECLWALRILSSLGYLGKVNDFKDYVYSTKISKETLSAVEPFKKQFVWEINRSLKESHL